MREPAAPQSLEKSAHAFGPYLGKVDVRPEQSAAKITPETHVHSRAEGGRRATPYQEPCQGNTDSAGLRATRGSSMAAREPGVRVRPPTALYRQAEALS